MQWCPRSWCFQKHESMQVLGQMNLMSSWCDNGFAFRSSSHFFCHILHFAVSPLSFLRFICTAMLQRVDANSSDWHPPLPLAIPCSVSEHEIPDNFLSYPDIRQGDGSAGEHLPFKPDTWVWSPGPKSKDGGSGRVYVVSTLLQEGGRQRQED